MCILVRSQTALDCTLGFRKNFQISTVSLRESKFHILWLLFLYSEHNFFLSLIKFSDGKAVLCYESYLWHIPNRLIRSFPKMLLLSRIIKIHSLPSGLKI